MEDSCSVASLRNTDAGSGGGSSAGHRAGDHHHPVLQRKEIRQRLRKEAVIHESGCYESQAACDPQG